MTEADGYYQVLGVSRDADTKAIKEAFRRLTLETHPDRSDEPGAEERYRKVTEAYAVLSDPEKRARYDARGRAGVADLSAEDLVGGIDLADLFGWSGLGGSLFERFFAGRGSPRTVRRGGDVELRIRVPLRRIADGGTEDITLEHPSICRACRGTGAAPDGPRRICPTCRGDGSLLRTQRRGATVFQQLVTCPDCAGRGERVDVPCRAWAGDGQAQTSRTLSLQIPRGLEEGAVLKLAGMGLPSPDPAGPPGHAYVVVQTQADPRFVRRGAHLRHTVALEPPELVLGTRVEVPTLDGEVIVTVPSRTSPGTVLRLAGKGLPQHGTTRVGDLEVVVNLQLAEDLSDEETRLYARLRDLGARRSAGGLEPEDGSLVPQPEGRPTAPKKRWWWPLRRWWPFGRT